LLHAMRRFQTDEVFRERVAHSAYEGFVKYWSESAVLPRYLDIIRKTAMAKGRTEIVRKLESARIA
jgi:hypothetical protein